MLFGCAGHAPLTLEGDYAGDEEGEGAHDAEDDHVFGQEGKAQKAKNDDDEQADPPRVAHQDGKEGVWGHFEFHTGGFLAFVFLD